MRPLILLLILCINPAIAENEFGMIELANSGSPEAQSPFLRGLAQLHNFEYNDAASAFRQAQQIDPNFALAYWGEAMTHNHPIWMQQDAAAARAILQRLAETEQDQLEKAGSPLEKDFMKAIHILYGDGDKKLRDHKYSNYLGEMYKTHPRHPEVGAFYALSLLGTAHGGRDFSIYMRSAAISSSR